MSASPIARQACTTPGQDIPTRKVVLLDASQLPANYSSTPGGTLYSTTPGGTKIIYDRSFLKNLKSSPLSQTPPKNIPNCLLRGTPKQPFRKCVPVPIAEVKIPSKKIEDHDQFQIEL